MAPSRAVTIQRDSVCKANGYHKLIESCHHREEIISILDDNERVAML